MSSALRSLLLVTAVAAAVSARTVNISNAWLLPQEGYPVFYRYFRDRITWFEADAVCQFHHANLVTVETSAQFDATRAYLKELDVNNNVWIGLKRSGPNEPFLWPNYSAVDPSAGGAGGGGGSWLEQAARGEGPQCAATDPAADFRWHSLDCGGPAVASFICEMPVPPWARAEDGCLLVRSLPSLTVTFVPEEGAVELAADCGLGGTRRVACKGQASREEIERQLECEQQTTTAVPPPSPTPTQWAANTESQTIQHHDAETTTFQSSTTSTVTPSTSDAPVTTLSITSTTSAVDQEADGVSNNATEASETRPTTEEETATDTSTFSATETAAVAAETSTVVVAASSSTEQETLQYEPEAPPPRAARKRRLQRPQERAGAYPYLLRVLG